MAKLKGKYIDDATIAEVKLDINNAPSADYVLKWNDTAGKMEWASETVIDAHDVIVSANDTTPGFLNGKLIAVSGKTTLTENNDGANETLSIGIGADIFDHTSDTSDDVTEGTTHYFVTSAEKTVIGNTSGTNSGDEVVASGAEVDTGTDNTKMVTAKAVKDSKVSYTDGTETLTNKTLTSPKINENVVLTATATELNLLAGITSIETTLVGGATTLARSDAIKTYADNIIAAADAMTYKGATNCSANPNYPAANAGDTYKVSVAGKIGGASGTVVEVGDMFICLVDSTASGDQATVGANWNILQVNIDGAVIGPASAVDDRLATFNGTSGTLIQDGGIAITSVFNKSLDDTADLTEATDKKFVTDAQLVVIGNTSGSNSGDEVVATGAEVDTGTDNAKMVTAKAIADSKYITSDGTETLTNKTFNANGTGNSISNIDVADLANGTDGELITWSAAGVPTTVAAGSSTQVLTSNGAGAAPTFQTAPAGSTRKVQIITVDATDITNKYNDDMVGVPITATAVGICPVGGIPQEYAVDFTVITDGSDINRINWNGLGLESTLVVGDKLIVTFTY